MSVKTKYDPQPLISWMIDRKWSYAGLAREIPCDYKHLYHAARGISVPSPLLRQRLPEILQLPLSSLFKEEVLRLDFGQFGRKVSFR